MDWVRSNKFLAGFIAVMLVATGGVGFWLYTTYSGYQQTAQEYTTQVTELKRLQALNPYPEEANLTRFAEQKKAYADAVTALQASLAKMSAPAEKPLSPSEFQNKLREVVGDLSRSATQLGVGLPENFYLGFEQYRTSLPDATAMPQLTTQLSDVEQIVRILINRKVDKINSIRRAPLTGETQSLAPTPGSEKQKPAANEMVTRHAVEFAFTAAPNPFREALAQLTAEKRLYVLRALQVKNQSDKGPTRGADSTVPGGTSAAPAVAQGQAAGGQPLPEKSAPPLRYVLGQEKVDVILYLELPQVLAPK